MRIDPSVFKDYDIRAVVDEQLDEAGVERLGRALAEFFQPKRVAVGYDMRVSSPGWFRAIVRGLTEIGTDVIDLGMISTDMAYFAAGTLDVDLAVMISASHNPPQFNGLKIVKRGARGVSGDSGIYELRDLVTSDRQFRPAQQPGRVTRQDMMADWVAHALQMVEVGSIKPLKVVVDAGNGMAGQVIPAIANQLPIKLEPLFFELDGTFPNHLANPLLEETHGPIIAKIKETKADLGIMFDGDGDRMFLMDETGRFISGTITTAMVAEQLLKKHPGSTILYNAICGRVAPETIEAGGGTAIRVRVGHTIIKEKMRQHDALFAGEHSGHYFFKQNFSADSGLIAALVVLELLSAAGQQMSQLVARYDKYPSSGEINFAVQDKEGMMKGLEQEFSEAESIDWLDGISIWYSDWWANIRPSNTQPVLRLNVEADNQHLLDDKTKLLIEYIEGHGGSPADEH
ncbi:MAG: phosphomannomutase/phosphoglucomutase [Candidatus Pacebacteria bacterium CG10_big_fil_rev_8_21_14_0_10_56_10]|nr:MAG: phosphomannomutase/phosphoglucomutase [Candidatus Pacebacteria bacterium CG10_big_fil_rev_8_21_14_0_10_56_10]